MAGAYKRLGPLEGFRVLVMGMGECIDGTAHIPRGGGVKVTERPSPKDAEPDLHLIEPGSMSGSVMEMDVGVSGQPPIMLGFMGVEVVKDYM